MSRRKWIFLALVLFALAGAIAAFLVYLPVPPTTFDLIQEGMTRDEVVSLLGEPSNCAAAGSAAGVTRVANWTAKNWTIYVTFNHDYRVQSKRLLSHRPLGVLDRLLGWLGDGDGVIASP